MHRVIKKYKEKYGLKVRGSDAMTLTNLKFCDTGELFTLLSTLGNLDCTRIQIKINEYFARTIGGVAFIIEHADLPACIKVRAIGRVPLESPLILKEDAVFLNEIHASHRMNRIEREDFEGKLYCELERVLYEEYMCPFETCLMFPVKHPVNDQLIPYYVALVNVEEFFNCDHIYNGIITECMSHCFGMINSAKYYEEEKLHHENCKAILSAFIEIYSAVGTENLFEEIRIQSMETLGASSCNLYLVNEKSELFLKLGTNQSQNNGKTEDIKMLIRHVAESGQLFKCDDPKEEPLYGSCASETVPRNLISFPICLRREVLGVVEVLNKNPPLKSFGKNDESLATPLSNVVGIALNIHDNFRLLEKQRQRVAYRDCLLLRRIKQIDDYHEVKRILECKQRHWYYHIADIKFNPLSVPTDHNICVCLMIFEEMGLLRKFHIKREKFVRFLVKVRHAYNTLPFHNWLQGFATMHFTFACINQLNLVKTRYITVMEAFTLLLASLCHCLDSRGCTTMFQMTSGTVIANLFSSPLSLHQTYCASQALMIINCQEFNFLESLKDEKFYLFSSLFIAMVKDTDVSFLSTKLQHLDAMACKEYDHNNLKHRRLIHNLILNSAQMHYVCKKWNYCRQIGEACFNEFFRKGDLSHAMGIFEISELNEDILKLPELNTNFISNICHPVLRVFIKQFPLMSVCQYRIVKNLKMWRAEKEQILATMTRDAMKEDDNVIEE